MSVLTCPAGDTYSIALSSSLIVWCPVIATRSHATGVVHRLTCFAAEMVNPVRWVHMLVKGAWVRTIPKTILQIGWLGAGQ